jgi:hypothetical protein
MVVTGAEDAVRSVVMDYVEGWFEGDADRMERALHPELVKRCRGSRVMTRMRWRR